MQARPGYRKVRSMLRIVEKMPARTEMTYGKIRVIAIISKSFFFLPKSKRGEFRGAIEGRIDPEMYIGPWALSEDT